MRTRAVACPRCISPSPAFSRQTNRFSDDRTSDLRQSDRRVSPVAPTAADDNDEQAERQVDGDDLADAVEIGRASCRERDYVWEVDVPRRAEEQQEEGRPHHPTNHPQKADAQAGARQAADA